MLPRRTRSAVEQEDTPIQPSINGVTEEAAVPRTSAPPSKYAAHGVKKPDSSKPERVVTAANIRAKPRYTESTPTTTEAGPLELRKKPHDQLLVRVRPEEEWCIPVCLFDSAALKATFVVCGEDMQDWLRDKGYLYVRLLFLAMDENRRLFVWMAPEQPLGDTGQQYTSTHYRAVMRARSVWTRMRRNKNEAFYTIETTTLLPEPEWDTTMTPDDMVQRAFGDAVIWDEEHPAIQKLFYGKTQTETLTGIQVETLDDEENA